MKQLCSGFDVGELEMLVFFPIFYRWEEEKRPSYIYELSTFFNVDRGTIGKAIHGLESKGCIEQDSIGQGSHPKKWYKPKIDLEELIGRVNTRGFGPHMFRMLCIWVWADMAWELNYGPHDAQKVMLLADEIPRFDEEAKFLDQAKKDGFQEWFMCWLMLYRGLRVGEVVGNPRANMPGLRVEDLRDHGILVHGKK